MTCTDAGLPTDERNLVMKAAALLRREYGVQHGVTFHLEKHIPYGAGLGGGSSDAAAGLVLLNTIWGLDLPLEALGKAALELGSDVPFFLGAETALGRGRGERLEPLIDPESDEPYRPPYPLVVAVPRVHVATAEAYAMVTPRGAGRPDLWELVRSNDLHRWCNELVNDFEHPVLSQYPAIREVKTALESAGGAYASLTGSGSAVFAFFEEEDQAGGAAEALSQAGHRVWMGRA